MVQMIFDRRQLLRGLLVCLSPIGSLPGCSGVQRRSGPSAIDAAVPDSGVAPSPPGGMDAMQTGAQAFMTYYQYSGDQVTNVNCDLDTTTAALTPVPNRFESGGFCYEFSGPSSSVLIQDIPQFPQADFALFLWIKSSSTNTMRMLNFADPAGNGLSILVNQQSALSVYWDGRPLLMTGNVGGSTDNNWHHVAIQGSYGNVQLLIDGIPVASHAASASLPKGATLAFGGGGAQAWVGAIDGVRLYNRAFNNAVIPEAVYRWSMLKPADPANATAAFFPFNGNADGANGHGTDGIVHNAVLTSNRFNVQNGAYLFNGTDAYIALNYDFDLTGTDFVLAFWAMSSSPSTMTAVSIAPGITALDIVFNGPSSGVAVDLNGATILSSGSAGQFTDGKWHFIQVQQAGSTLALYIDGTLQGTAQSGAVVVLGEGAMARFGTGSGVSGNASGFWNGALDDIQIYGQAFTSSAIEAMQSMQYMPRDGAGVLTLNGRMWLLGGWNPGRTPVTNNEVWSSADGIAWTFVTLAPWQGRHAAGWTVFNDQLWVVGGDDNDGRYQNDVWSSPDGLNWKQVASEVPWANRATQYVLPFNGRLWLMGGQEVFSSSVVAYNDVYASTDGATWELITAAAQWSRRGIILGQVVYNNQMWVIGGGLYDTPTYLNDVWSSPDGVTWTCLNPNAPWAGRHYHNIFVFDHKIWVIAGATAAEPSGTTDVWYSVDGINWVPLQGTPWPARHAAAVWVINNKLMIGCGSALTSFDDIWQLSYAP